MKGILFQVNLCVKSPLICSRVLFFHCCGLPLCMGGIIAGCPCLWGACHGLPLSMGGMSWAAPVYGWHYHRLPLSMGGIVVGFPCHCICKGVVISQSSVTLHCIRKHSQLQFSTQRHPGGVGCYIYFLIGINERHIQCIAYSWVFYAQ